MTIPGGIAKRLGIEIGTEMDVTIVDGALMARPRAGSRRTRYSLDELLAGATPAAMRRLAKATDWAREGEPVGREL